MKKEKLTKGILENQIRIAQETIQKNLEVIKLSNYLLETFDWEETKEEKNV